MLFWSEPTSIWYVVTGNNPPTLSVLPAQLGKVAAPEKVKKPKKTTKKKIVLKKKVKVAKAKTNKSKAVGAKAKATNIAVKVRTLSYSLLPLG